MSTRKEELLLLVGSRLREEREKIGLSQDALASVLGLSTKTWGKYERGVTNPDAATLSLLSGEFGFDVFYVLFGVRGKNLPELTKDEVELVELYRIAPLAVKAAALAALTAGSSTVSIKVSGNGNRVAGRDYNGDKE
ncbi:helix-turn-helix domain-containing protein [Salmonella enterica]|uniref:helix-turn-helix domain-containing protein n=1 Tax=Salmonella enterica TaxID=28901 RepID=UPI00193D80C6|nr:helix-turn-helix transcriptional regulator [Salmonella enterica]EEN5588404.1 helix-turn-helix domain-containing protein [Salmonella enterica subsp. enterica serovar Mountpleasant]